MTVPLSPRGPLMLAAPEMILRSGKPGGIGEDLRPGMWPWRVRWSQRFLTNVPIVALGEASDLATSMFPEYAWPGRLGYLLRGDRHYSKSRGGIHWRATNAMWTTSGTMTRPAVGQYDMGADTAQLATNAYLERSATCTGFEIYFHNGPGLAQFTLNLDGTPNTQITPGNTAGKRPDAFFYLGPLTRGSHTLRIISNGATSLIGSVYAVDDDSLLGVRVYQASYAASTVRGYLDAGFQVSMSRISQLNPALVIIAVGGGDYAANVSPATFAGDVGSILLHLRMTCSPMTSYLLVHKPRRLDVSNPTYPWTAYRDQLRNLAAINPDTDFLDISPHWPTTQNADYLDLIDSAGSGLTMNGHSLMADLIGDHLLRPASARSAPTGVGATITTTAPSALSGVLAAWRASDLTSGTIASWAPYAGTQSSPLAQSDVNRRPAVVTDTTINGRKFAQFENAGSGAVGTLLQTGSWGGQQSVPLTVAFVFRKRSQLGVMYSGRSVASWVRQGPFESDGWDMLDRVEAGSTTSPATAFVWNNMGRWAVGCMVFNGASSKYWQTAWGGALTVTTATVAQQAAAGLNGVTLGGNYDATNAWDGDIAEFIVYNRALSDSEAQGVIDYWARVYGLDWSARTSVQE